MQVGFCEGSAQNDQSEGNCTRSAGRSVTGRQGDTSKVGAGGTDSRNT